jgi:hypothetical protein
MGWRETHHTLRYFPVKGDIGEVVVVVVVIYCRWKGISVRANEEKLGIVVDIAKSQPISEVDANLEITKLFQAFCCLTTTTTT